MRKRVSKASFLFLKLSDWELLERKRTAEMAKT